jgi:hypothetical protein
VGSKSKNIWHLIFRTMGEVNFELRIAAGLGAALTNVGSHGYSAAQALNTGGRIGTAVGVLGGVSDSALQFSPPANAGDCTCRR